MAFGRLAAPGEGPGEGDEEGVFADINITPLVDVVLVLLLIFMVTAPMLSMTMDVNLPEVATAAPASPQAVIITVGKEGDIAMDDRVLPLEEVVAAAVARHGEGGGAIYLRADRDVPYGLFVSVLDALRAAGIDDLSLVTKPLPRTATKPPATPKDRGARGRR